MHHRIKQLFNPLRPAALTARYCWLRFKPGTSYADDFEDIAATMLLGGVERFVDVGANNGYSCSNTALAAMRGARGLCFEPSPIDFKRLRGFYRWAKRIECIPEGLSDTAGMVQLRCDGLLSAVTATEDVGLTNLLTGFYRHNASVISIHVDRLSAWLARRPDFAASDLLSIDVEGHELSVLRGIDWIRHPKPARCLIVETHANGKTRQWRHRDFDEIAALLARQGYRKMAASRNNTIWLHEEDLLDLRVREAKTRLPHYLWFYDEHSNRS
jgi:FkbM family methyltransferase